jgi:hypothetical protein
MHCVPTSTIALQRSTKVAATNLAIVGLCFATGMFFIVTGSVTLAGLPRTVEPLWKPGFVPSALWLVAVGGMASVEVVYGFALGLGLFARGGSGLVGTVALAVVLTVYGLASLKRRGHCGCNGVGTTSSFRLVVRNGFLFSIAALLAELGDDAHRAIRRSEEAFALVGTLPLAGLILAVLLQVVRERVRQSFPRLPLAPANRSPRRAPG